jgi:hypothetical protein
MLLTMPEFRNWARTRLSLIRLNRGTFAYWGLGLTFLYAALFNWESLNRPASFWSGLFFMPFLCLQTIHVLGQVRGLASMYSVQGHAVLDFSEKEQLKIYRQEKLEKILFRSIGFLIIVISVVNYISNPRFGLLSFRAFAFGTALLMGFGVILNAFFMPKSSRSNKSWYICRVLYAILAVGGLIPWAAFASRSLHGIEYLAVCRKMNSRSQWRFSKGAIIGFFVLAYAFALLTHEMSARDLYPLDLPKPVVKFFFAFSFLRGYGHYFLDAILFRFHNPDIRKTLGPLLGGRASESQPLVQP